jgi:hypothetical protein
MERRVKAIQQKLDRLDEAFLFAQAIDELDVEGILAFAEHPQTYGRRPRSITSSDCSSCSFLRESRTTEIDSIEPR